MKQRSRLVLAAMVFFAAAAFGQEPTRTVCPEFVDPDARTPADWLAIDLYCRVQQLTWYARMSPNKETSVKRYAAVLPHAELLLAARADDVSYSYLVWAQFKSGDVDRATRTGQEWIKTFPQSLKAHLAMAQLLPSVRDQLESALHHGQRALELAVDEKDRYNIRMQIGFILEKLHRYREAIALYEELGAKAAAERAKASAESVVSLTCDFPQQTEELKRQRAELEKMMEALRTQTKAAEGGG